MSSESRCKSTMLRKIRIGISALFFVLITFFFLDFAEILPNSFHRLAHLQFVPALLSLSVGILLFLIVLTLLFGRIYCSTICPMGILQDIIARLSKSTSKKNKIHGSYFQCFSFGKMSYCIQRHLTHLVEEFGSGCVHRYNIR